MRSSLAASTTPATTAACTSDEQHLIDALAKRGRARLLAVFEEERSHVEELLLGMLVARGL